MARNEELATRAKMIVTFGEDEFDSGDEKVMLKVVFCCSFSWNSISFNLLKEERVFSDRRKRMRIVSNIVDDKFFLITVSMSLSWFMVVSSKGTWEIEI